MEEKIRNEITPFFQNAFRKHMSPIIRVWAENLLEGKDNIYKLFFVPELNRMNANIVITGNKAVVHGKEDVFKPAQVMASDLRASVSLVLAGLCASGETQVRRAYHLERGYEFLADKLNNCGADIKIVYE